MKPYYTISQILIYRKPLLENGIEEDAFNAAIKTSKMLFFNIYQFFYLSFKFRFQFATSQQEVAHTFTVFTPGGWHEAKCVNWKVSVAL